MVITFPCIESEDIRYVYGVARVRALEVKLLTSQKISRLVGLAPLELLKSLQDTDYAPYLPQSPYEYESIINTGRNHLFLLMQELIMDLSILQFLRSKFDNHNIKMGLKVKIIEGQSFKFSPFGNISTSYMLDIFKNERYSKLPFPYEDGVNEAIESYYTNKDPSMLDIILDKTYFQYQEILTRGTKNDFLSALLKIDIDITNIKTLLRIKWANTEKKRFVNAIIKGGFISTSELLSSYDDTWENMAERFKYTPYSTIFYEAIPDIFKENSFLKLEKLCDDLFIDFLRKTRFLTFGVEPVITYFYAKEMEFKILRILFTASIYGIKENVFKDRLPEVYG